MSVAGFQTPARGYRIARQCSEREPGVSLSMTRIIRDRLAPVADFSR
jgi:hypothetical protein